MKMGSQFPPERWWSGCSGIQAESALFTGGQFAPESGGQFDRILQQSHPLIIAFNEQMFLCLPLTPVAAVRVLLVIYFLFPYRFKVW
jgi:hypothetical protein